MCSARRLTLVTIVAGAALLVCALLSAQVHAADLSGLKVTIAARYCPTYDSITANLARNDIQESLQDLGKDTVYESGQPINPGLEALNQPRCRSLSNWDFTLGQGYQSRAVSGPWGSLSIVTGPFSTAIRTKDSVPLLNSLGQNTGRRIRGATTIELTKEQADIAAHPNGLWVQGGTTTDPILNALYPGQYGFGALRCAIDNLNGDNVEWIGFPQGATHVFCYAYYVTPPPTSGTIVVRKQVDSPDISPLEFRFDGNISFNADGTFGITAGSGSPGQTTFYRAGGQTWSFREQVPTGWQLTGLSCTSAGGTSTFTTDVATAAASVTLAANDTVTCTYRDAVVPPPAGLLLSKVTFGGTGRFAFRVAGPQNVNTTATTTKPRVVTPAADAFTNLPPGAYTISETSPRSDSGAWRLVAVRCNGRLVTGTPTLVTLVSGTGSSCVFANAFVPKGEIIIRKVTVGATGTTGFSINPIDPRQDSPITYLQSATTTKQGVAVRATGDATDNVPLGVYDLRETTPTGAGDGRWTTDTVTCNGVPAGAAQGRVRVALTTTSPSVDCTVVNRFTEGAKPTPPTPDSGAEGESTSNPTTNLVVTKTASPTLVRVGRTVGYRIVVENRGRQTANHVSANEVTPRSTQQLSVHTSKGSCGQSRPVVCHLGSLKPGQHVVLTTRVRQNHPGKYTNYVAISTSTNETRLVDNRAQATIRVITGPRFTG